MHVNRECKYATSGSSAPANGEIIGLAIVTVIVTKFYMLEGELMDQWRYPSFFARDLGVSGEQVDRNLIGHIHGCVFIIKRCF